MSTYVTLESSVSNRLWPSTKKVACALVAHAPTSCVVRLHRGTMRHTTQPYATIPPMQLRTSKQWNSGSFSRSRRMISRAFEWANGFARMSLVFVPSKRAFVFEEEWRSLLPFVTSPKFTVKWATRLCLANSRVVKAMLSSGFASASMCRGPVLFWCSSRLFSSATSCIQHGAQQGKNM